MEAPLEPGQIVPMQSIILLFVSCALSSIVIPVPEDLPLLAAGAQIDSTGMLLGFMIAGALGVFLRDAFWFGLGRLAGEGVLRWPLVRRLLGESRLLRARDLVDRRGGRAVFIARFLIGFRSPAFLVAGALGVRIRHFVLWDGVGVLVSTPLALGLGYLVGDPVNAALAWLLDHRLLVAALGAILVFAWVTSQMSRHAEREPSPNPV